MDYKIINTLKPIFKKFGVYIVAAVIFFALAYIYCFPQLQGKVVYAGDNIQGWSAVQESVQYTKDTGDHTFWNGAMFSGMPNYQIGGGKYNSKVLLKPFDKILHSGHKNTALILVIYFVCFFILLRSFKVDKWLSIAGALAIGLSTYFLTIIAAGHNGKTSTIALMSVVFAGMNFIFQNKYGLGIIITMLFTSMGFYVHPQMAYYMFLLMGVYWIGELVTYVKNREFKGFAIKTGIFAACVLIGLGTSVSTIFANSEYTSQTMRGGHSDLVKESVDAKPSKGLDVEYATQWSYGKDETLSLMIPGVLGGANAIKVGENSVFCKTLVKHGVPRSQAKQFAQQAPLYWGDQPFTAGNVYVGAIVCFLFLLGMLIVPGPKKWALFAATVLSIMLAWGHNCMWLTELFFKYFPLYNKFRAVSSILIVAEIAMPVLGFMAIQEIIKGNDKSQKYILISGGITAGICLFFTLFGGSIFSFTSVYDASWAKGLPDWFYGAVVDQRKELLRTDSLRSALFIIASALVLLLYSYGKLKQGFMVAALGVLVVADLYPVNRRYFNDDNWTKKKNQDAAYQMLPYEEAILQDESYFRVFNLTTSSFNDARTSYYLKSIGGYSAAKLRRYQDLIDEHLSKMHLPVINMLNTKYIIVPGDNGQPKIEYNADAMGNAWFVDKLFVADNANQESGMLMQIDLKHEAVIDKSFVNSVSNLEPGIASDAQVICNSYTPKELDYIYTSSTPGVIVFSEVYYPYGWKATIDGTPADHYRVNYTLRGMDVPAGSHNIHFVFDPDSVRKGDIIATVFVILMYLISLGIIAKGVYTLVKKNAA